jgi:hypothetical protein
MIVVLKKSTIVSFIFYILFKLNVKEEEINLEWWWAGWW